MKRLVQIMYAVTAGLEQTVIVWESMKQAERLAIEAPQTSKRQIGFARKDNDVGDLQKSSPTTLDPRVPVTTL